MRTVKFSLWATAVILVMLLSRISPLLSQTRFQRTYGGNADDYGFSVQQTFDGGYVIAGRTSSFGHGGDDVYVIKTNSVGDTIWTRIYGGNADDYGFSVQQTSDGGYIIVGNTRSFGAGNSDVYLIKINSAGDTLWTRTYGGSHSDYGRAARETSDSGYIIVGFTWSFGIGGDVYLIKTNSMGDTLWTRTYGGASSDYGQDVRQISDGGYIIVGSTPPFTGIGGDVYLIKTNSMGDTLWTRTYGGSLNDDNGWCVQQTSDWGYIIAGGTYSSVAGNRDVYLIKTNSMGDTLWTRTYGSQWYNDDGGEVQQTSDGGYIVAGRSVSFDGGTADVYLIKTDSMGDTLWTRTYGLWEYFDYSNSVQQTSDGGYIIGGSTRSFGAGGFDVYLIKTDGKGLITSVADNDPNGIPSEFNLKQNFPNPFNPTTTISYTLPTKSHVTLKVFDVLGRDVAILANRVEAPGYKSVTFDGSKLSSGMYFYRLQSDNFIETKKLVLLR